MLRRFASLFLFSALFFSAIQHQAVAETAFQQIQSVVQTLSEISGFPELHPVPYGRMNKRQLRQFLAKRIRKTLRPEEIRADELALKMFGLVPQDFDLKASTIDLITEQAAAFYDYDEKKLFLLGNSSESAEVMTLAHELSHALADQHFNLGKYMDEENMEDDENLARSAVVEGQASWLMIAYELKQAGQPPEPTREALNSMLGSSESSLDGYPVLKSSPLYIQQSLLFPYTDGTIFFDAVYRKQGKAAFAGVFTHPPVDSGQVLHPQRYFEHVTSREVVLPDLTELKGASKLNEGSVGEFDHRILLWQYLNEQTGKRLAAHLTGSDFQIVGLGKEQRPILVYGSHWDSQENATEFFGDYEKILRGKWKTCDVSGREADSLAGQGDNGFFVVRHSGHNVTSVEGLPSVDLMKSIERQLRSDETVVGFHSPIH